ncbi:hypothetical protein AB0F43_09305 [Kribbella sp. NPDC023972]|uniref:hypothetical protein n=1 Tax=Kribbella sp. NPDC023972 TaxID=3154795 RepID=UPI0033F5F778
MADPTVLDLIRKVNQLVVKDTGGWSMATGDQLPELREYDEERLRRLADNLDIPARLAPGRAAILAAAGGRAEDDRPNVRMDLQNLVADCAYSLGPAGPVPEPGDPNGRIVLEKAVCQAYAELATPKRLAAELFENGQPDDVGMFPAPDEKGDAVAARALVLGITSRTRFSETEDEVLTALVRAGRGRIATEAAGLLLAENENFGTLPYHQQEAVRSHVAADLERSFATERKQPSVEGVLAATIKDRYLAASWGAAAIDGASKEGNQQVASRHTPPPAERPQSVPELIERMQGAIGQLTDVRTTQWNHQTAPMPPGREFDALSVANDVEDGTLYLHPDRVDWVLAQVTVDGPDQLTPERAEAVREAMQAVGVKLTELAAPEAAATDTAAQAARPEFDALAFGTTHGFSEDYLNQMITRTLPADLAEQVVASEPPYVDDTWTPAVRGFAQSIDGVMGRRAEPSETLGQLAGRHPAGIASRAAELVVRASGVPREDRPAVVQEVAERVDDAFKVLPDQVKAWKEAGTTDAQITAKSHQFGQVLGAEAHAIARSRAPEDPNLRFVPGRDLASARSASVTAPDSTPAANPTAAPGQSRSREREGR